jgi:hypothetical protein
MFMKFQKRIMKDFMKFYKISFFMKFYQLEFHEISWKSVLTGNLYVLSAVGF